MSFEPEVSATRPKAPLRPAADEADISRATRLAETAKELPQVRPDKVAHAKALLADPSYPNDAALEKVAGLLAGSLKAEGAG